jgi:hypothetical protein
MVLPIFGWKMKYFSDTISLKFFPALLYNIQPALPKNIHIYNPHANELKMVTATLNPDLEKA